MIVPDEKVLRAMVFMSNEPKVKPFIQWLYDNLLDGSFANNRPADTELMLRNAGANLRTEEIYESIRKANDILGKGALTKEKDYQAMKGF